MARKKPPGQNKKRKSYSLDMSTGDSTLTGSEIMARKHNLNIGNRWQLASGYYVPAKFSPVIVHPRPDAETAGYARCRNAYTGIRYTCPVNVFGGSYPFRYSIVTGPSGLTIGEILETSDDVLVEGEYYGIVRWDNPTESGSPHTVTVKVEDQDGNSTTVTWTITVGTSNWLFVDSGVSPGGAGTISDPFASTDELHDDDAANVQSSQNKLVYFRGGTHYLKGMTYYGNPTLNSNSDYFMDGNKTAAVFLGYPGESATVILDEGNWKSKCGDVFIGDITIEHTETPYDTDQKFLSGLNEGHRNSLFNCTFNNYDANQSSANAGVYTSLAGVAINYIAMSHCTMTGKGGPSFTTYNVETAVVERNEYVDMTEYNFNSTDPGIIFLKDSPVNISIRRNVCWDNTSPTGVLAIYGASAQNGHTNVEVCYNTFGNSNTDVGAVADFRFRSSVTVSNHFCYRNSVKQMWTFNKGVTMTLDNVVHEYNALDTGTMPSDAGLTTQNNIDGSTYFDSSMKLTGASRTSYLGTHGAEIKAQLR